MFEINVKRQPTYDPVAVQPLRDELTWIGFKELLTPDDVDEALSGIKGSALVMINSVCGCAAGSARPGVALALQHSVIPDNLVTVFAGMEKDAVDHFREKYLSDYPPSSPFIALFKDGKSVFVLQRYQIEGKGPKELADILTQVFDRLCTKQGPSIAEEKYDELIYAKMCGSKIPRLDEK